MRYTAHSVELELCYISAVDCVHRLPLVYCHPILPALLPLRRLSIHLLVFEQSPISWPSFAGVGEVEVMAEVFFHARLVLTVCVSVSQLHYVIWTEGCFFFSFIFSPHSHGLCFYPSGSLSYSYVNNLFLFATVTVK